MKLVYLIRQLITLWHVSRYDIQVIGDLVLYKGLSFKSHPSPTYLRRLPTRWPKYITQTIFDIYNRYRDVKEVRPGDVVIEAGAYIGFRAMKIAKTAKKVIAIEAYKDNYDILCRNIKANNIKNIEAYHCAISDYSGIAMLYLKGMQANSMNNNLIDGPSTLVICKPLSMFEKADFIRIQINGSELLALLGLDYCPRLLIANVYYRNDPDVMDLLKQRGYKIKRYKKHIYAEKNN